MTKSKLLEMNNVGIVVENLDNAISFFTEIGLKLEGRAMIEGEWAGRMFIQLVNTYYPLAKCQQLIKAVPQEK
jgi:hypothetical protein